MYKFKAQTPLPVYTLVYSMYLFVESKSDALAFDKF